ncbi:MAG: hypothetical protein NZ870_02185, partial [bacterium]|nr:hypothetical protein [bacterium]
GVMIDALLEDYAYLVRALIDLYEATLDYSYIEFAISINDEMLQKFYDEAGGFYDSNFFIKTKDVHDAIIPSANAVAIKNNYILFLLTGEKRYEKIVNDSINSLITKINYISSAAMLLTYRFVTSNKHFFVITGEIDKARNFLKKIYFTKNRVIVYVHPEKNIFKNFEIYKGGKTLLYVCDENACKGYVENPDEVYRILNG